MTLDDIAKFMQTPVDELGLQEKWDEYAEGVARRSTPQGFGEALVDELSMDPRSGDMGVLGAGTIHGVKSNLFPDSWAGPEGKAQKMYAAGASPRQIWDKSLEETGFGIYPQHLYNDDRTLKRIDWKMNVPDINLRPGRRSSVANMNELQDYPLSAFMHNQSTDIGYPGMLDKSWLTKVDNETLGDAGMAVKVGKYGDKGQNWLRVNKEFSDIEDSLLPSFAHEGQHIVQEAERFAPGSNPISDPNYRNQAGEVEARAVANEFDTITDLRSKGMDNREIIQYLGNNPIFENFDTPDIMQVVKNRLRNKSDDWQASDKNLIATHQLDADRADIAAYRKGLANPSIGIQKTDNLIPENEFGDSVLVGNKELIMPEEGMQVFNNDAYTTTYPSAVDIREHKLTTLQDISDYMYKRPEPIPSGVKEFTTYEDMINDKDFMDQYFEAKAQRVIGIDEFPGAMIPKQNFEKLAPVFEKRGVKDVVPFEPNSGEYEELLKDYFKYLQFGQNKKLDTIASVA